MAVLSRKGGCMESAVIIYSIWYAVSRDKLDSFLTER